MRYCPSCRITEDDDNAVLTSLHHVPDNHHSAREHQPDVEDDTRWPPDTEVVDA